jgi:hypothetical protein
MHEAQSDLIFAPSLTLVGPSAMPFWSGVVYGDGSDFTSALASNFVGGVVSLSIESRAHSGVGRLDLCNSSSDSESAIYLDSVIYLPLQHARSYPLPRHFLHIVGSITPSH